MKAKNATVRPMDVTQKVCRKCGFRSSVMYAKDEGDNWLCSRTCWEAYRAEHPRYPHGMEK